MELTSLPSRPISAIPSSSGPTGGIDDDSSSNLDRTVAAHVVKPTATRAPRPILKKHTAVLELQASAPSIAPSLLRLLDLLTFVGTAVATEDVFRPRNTAAAAAVSGLFGTDSKELAPAKTSPASVAFKLVNVPTQRLSPLAQGVALDGGGLDGATDKNAPSTSGNIDRGGRGNSKGTGRSGGVEELKDSVSASKSHRSQQQAIEQADLEEGLHQSLDEQIASFDRLKSRGLLTEDEYAQAVALIELQRLDLPGDEDPIDDGLPDSDSNNSNDTGRGVSNTGSKSNSNGSNSKTRSKDTGSNRKAVTLEWSISAENAAKDVNFGALLADDAQSFDPALQVVAAKYLLGVFVLDSLAMAVGKVALLEVVLFADELGYSVVATTLVVTAIEAVVEFVASAAVPFLYRLKFGTWALSARGLVQFAVSAYLTSATFAMVIYPIMGVLTQGMGNKGEADDADEGGQSSTRSPAMLLVFATCQIIQYPLLNQLGDQAVEMAQPHWLETFENTVLVTPGWKCVDKLKLHKASKVCCAILCGESAKNSALMCIFYLLCAPLVCLRSLCRCLCAGSSGSGAEARARAAAAKSAELSAVRHRGDDDDDEDDDDDNDNYDDDGLFREIHGREEEKEDLGNMRQCFRDSPDNFDRVSTASPLYGRSSRFHGVEVNTSRSGRIKSHKGWRSKWRFNLYASANNNSLAYFLALNRFVLTALFGAIYLMASRAGDSARWVALCTFSVISFSAARAMAKGFSTIECGIKHGVVEQNHAPTPWIFQMSGGEIALTMFATIAFTAPSDAASAIVVLVVTMTSSAVNLALVGFGGIVVVLHLRRKIKLEHLATKREDWVVVQKNPEADQKQSTSRSCYSEWLSMSRWKHFFKGCFREITAGLCCCCFPSASKNSQSKPSAVSSSYFARYWELSPAQVAAKEAARARRRQFWARMRSNLSACFKCATFGTWLCEYMCIVLILSLAAALLAASAGTEGLGFSAKDGDGGSMNNDGSGGGASHSTDTGGKEDDGGGGGPTNLLLLAGLLLIPYFALNANLKARFEAVLFHYKEGQVSGIVFHRNLFTVVLKAPVLYANWYALQASSLGESSNLLGSDSDSSISSNGATEEDDEAAKAAEDRYDAQVGGLVLIVSVAVLVVALIYFATVDRWHLFGKKRSATILVNRTTARVAAEVTQAAAARVLEERNNCCSNGDENGDVGDKSSAWKGGTSISSRPYMSAATEPPAASKVVEKVQVRGGGGYLPPLPPPIKNAAINRSTGSKKSKEKETRKGAAVAGPANGVKKDNLSNQRSKSENEATAAKTLSRADSRAALLKAKKDKKKAKADKLKGKRVLETADVMAPPPSMLVVGAGGLQKQTYETKARADALRAAVLENPENADALLGASAQMPLNSELIRDRCHNATAAGGGFTSPAQAAAFRMVAAAASSSPKGSATSTNAAAAAALGEEKGHSPSGGDIIETPTAGGADEDLSGTDL